MDVILMTERFGGLGRDKALRGLFEFADPALAPLRVLLQQESRMAQARFKPRTWPSAVDAGTPFAHESIQGW